MSDCKPFYLGGKALPIDFFTGPGQLAKLVTFCAKARLRIPQDPRALVARLAPSVVTRGEVQLFNLDVPRFCVRVYLDDNQGFLNLRRMEEVIKRLEGEEWILDTTPTTQAYRTPSETVTYYKPPMELPSPQAVFQQIYADGERNLIADCLLNPPKQMVDTHHFVTADLGWVYGEGESRHAVPYVCAMRGFSGGACAQACAFIVSSLLHEYPPSPRRQAGIHGLAEITAMTTPFPFDLMMRGLRLDVLAEYFVRAGRTVMKFKLGVDASLEAISAYVRSGFAPIIAVAEPSDDNPLLEFNHVVVAVGAKKSGGPELIIHDPSDYPFCPWSSNQYSSRCAPHGKLPSTFCVLPTRVACPLTKASIVSMDDVELVERSVRYGVYEMAAEMATQYNRAGLHYADPKLSDFTLTQLLLIEAGPSTIINSLPKGIADRPRDDSLESFWIHSEELAAFAGHWVWLQKIRGSNHDIASITVWDAELQPNGASVSLERCKAHLLLSVWKTAKGWKVRHFASDKAVVRDMSSNAFEKPPRRPDSQAGTKTVGSKFHTGNSALSPCLITSFTATNLSLAFDPEVWPNAVKFAEVYAFMHCDNSLFEQLNDKIIEPGGIPSAVERLATLRCASTACFPSADSALTAEDRKHLEQERLARVVRSYAERTDVKIRAIATHMPQLYSENPLKAAQARDALCTLAQMREKLKDAHDIRVIEISAGSRVRGLVPRMSARQLRDVSRGYHDNRKAAKIHKNLTFFTSRRTEAESIRVLIRRLKRVVRHMKRALGVEDLDFALALEIEPGPLFVLNSIHSVRRVADRIRSEKDLNQVVGFNIDIAHCILAGIQPLDIFDRGIVEDRVCHFHISDHGIGHFGDAPLGDCGFGRWVLSRTDRLGVFTDWLDHANAFAQRVREKAQRRPRFSEVISVELEAVRFPHQIEDSVQTLSELLDAPNRPGRTGFLEVRGNALQDIERLVQGIEQRTVNFRRVRGLRQLVPSGVWWEPVRSAWHYLSGR